MLVQGAIRGDTDTGCLRVLERHVCFGNGLPNGQACGAVGTTYLAGLALKW